MCPSKEVKPTAPLGLGEEGTETRAPTGLLSPPNPGSAKSRSSTSTSSGFEAVRSVLRSITLGDFLRQRPPGRVVTFDVDTKIAHVLGLFETVGIKSAPVFDGATNQFLGFVDCSDILALILDMIDVRSTPEDERVYRLNVAGRRLENAALEVLWDMNDGELVHRRNEHRPLYDLFLFGLGANGGDTGRVMHRMGVFEMEHAGFPAASDPGVVDVSGESMDLSGGETLEWSGCWSVPSGACQRQEGPDLDVSEEAGEGSEGVRGPALRVLSIVSQRDLLHFILRNGNMYEDLLNRGVGELGLGRSPVVSVAQDMPCINAFATMVACGVSNVGIVNQRNGGRLLGNLSVSDLRGLRTGDFGMLALPVLRYVICREVQRSMPGREYPREESLNEWGVRMGELHKAPKLGKINAEHSLRHVIELMLNARLPAIYIVDVAGRATKVITKTDVLRLFKGSVQTH